VARQGDSRWRLRSRLEPPVIRPETELAFLALAVARAARYSELTFLMPARPDDREDCAGCHGAGRVPVLGVEAEFNCRCGGLGWLPRDASELGLL
jgi:hypothetical protein